ncbi:MAG: hypothetical protein ACLUIR_05815 [Faecalibacterium prausnitzii]
MKLKFTRKTWYFLLLASAAASMLNGFAVLSGTSFGLIEQIAFAAAGIAALFLAAEKGSASWEKRNFTGVFVLLMVSYMVNGWAGYLCSALAWRAAAEHRVQAGWLSSASSSWWVRRRPSTCSSC